VTAIRNGPKNCVETPELPDETSVKLLPPTAFLLTFFAAVMRFAGQMRALRSRRLRAGMAILLATSTLPARAALPMDLIKLPPGFHIEILSDAVPSARAMTYSPRGILYLGSLDGHVYALELQNGHVTARHVIASGLQTPAGVAWRDGALYVSAVSTILRFDAIDTQTATGSD
jgi:glucose/arabinose dehydrogenase